MAERLEINLFTIGDSSVIKTWSNLPYFFSNAIVNKGIKLNRINILSVENLIYKYYLKFFFKRNLLARKLLSKNYIYDPCRDYLTCFLANQKISKEAQKYTRSRMNIFLTYSFSSYQYSRIPVVHYCDQVYELYLEDRKKSITKKDIAFIETEKKILENATHIFATNETCAEFITSRYNLKNVTTLKGGINFESQVTDNEDKILAEKMKNKDILFIGKLVHKAGVDILIKAFQQFNRQNAKAFTLHLVGISPKDVNYAGENIRFYGYLDKNNPSELRIYSHLLKTARLFVMPMREGPRPGVLKEAGLMYTPVIITNIWHMDEVIQNNINGILVDHPNPGDFADQMNYLVKNEALWEKLAKNAHKMVQEYSWDNAVDNFFSICSKCRI